MAASNPLQKTDSLTRHSNRTATLLILLALVPPTITALFISHYWVNSHLADEWNAAVFFERFAIGTLTFGHLFGLQNEFRQFFPNVLFLVVGWITKWDVRYLMVLSFVAACVVSLNIYILGRRTLDVSRSQRLGIYFLSNLLIFSPVQYENWLQGQQLIYFFPIVLLTASLVICTSAKLSLTAKFLLCALAATISTFSSANGVFCWVVVLPVLLSLSQKTERRRRWLSVFWVASCGACIALYLYRFRSTPGHPSRLVIIQQPLNGSTYLLSLLGNPLTVSSSVKLAAFIGLLLAVAYAWMLVEFWKSRHAQAEIETRTLWLMLGAYSVLTAAMITVARVGFGLWQSRSSRYATFTLYLVVALIHLLAIKFLRRPSSGEAAYPFKRATTVGVFAGILVFAHLGLYVIAVRQFSNFKIRFVQAKVCTVFINVIVSDDCAAISFHEDLDLLKSRANAVDALGFIRPPLVKTDHIEEIQGSADASGSIEDLTSTGGDEYVASGTAFLLRRNEPADAVLLVYERKGEPGRIFAIAFLNNSRDYVSQLLRRGVYADTRWSTKFKTGSLQLHGTTVSAWAYDLETGKASRLSGSFALPDQTTSNNP